MTDGQREAIEQLREIEASSHGVFEVLGITEESHKVRVEVTLFCGDMPRKAGGLRLRQRERFSILVGPDFPFDVPGVWTSHKRFAGFPHVQWSRHLCLYQAPSVEWDVSDGMFGFILRLDEWLRQAATDELDPIGAPLHPPVAYVTSAATPMVIPRANTPSVGDEPWFGFANLKRISDTRLDIEGWTPLGSVEKPPLPGAAILLPKPFPFEFPSRVADVVKELEERGVSRSLLLVTLQLAALRTPEEVPLYVVIGTPVRGIRGSGDLKQHLTVWQIDPALANGLRLSTAKYDEEVRLQEIGEEVERIIWEWASAANVEWCEVREDRPEIVTRRDHKSATSWFAGKSVAVWGCGALGGYASEFLVRAGVRRMILVDNKRVGPGLLVRQLFDDADIGRPKADAIADRLKRINPSLSVESRFQNIQTVLSGSDWTDGADIVIDTTASEPLLAKLELVRHTMPDASRVPVVSMVVSARAERGMAVIVRPSHSGGPADVYRRAQLEVLNGINLQHHADSFWPPTAALFQPEPGCSEPTFVGSAADLAALSATLLNLSSLELSTEATNTAAIHLVTQPSYSNSGEQSHISFRLTTDRVLTDSDSGYEIRVAESAWKEMNAWIARYARTASAEVETGGLLFGEHDTATKVVWVSEVSGPPPDSVACRTSFICGTEGTQELNDEKVKRSHGRVQYIGMWHTHPDSSPVPSYTDLHAMKQLVAAVGISPTEQLLVIIGETRGHAAIGAYVLNRSDFQGNPRRRYIPSSDPEITEPKSTSYTLGLALSGGGFRAVAFHLGCLRALHDRGILDRVNVISAVSGGSLIAAMYAYSHDSFEEFDARVVGLLRRGLVRDILIRALVPYRVLVSVATFLVSGLSAIGADITRFLVSLVSSSDWPRKIQPPLRRWISWTTALEEVLGKRLFGNIGLPSPRRNDMHIVINACDLRTGSAFRFGSKESGCWRFGKLSSNRVRVSQAVAASAAYPVFLPALDERLEFVDQRGEKKEERVLLTDGGVFDNLGITVLEPGRSADFSSNVFDLEYLICCDAGRGLMNDSARPYWWMPRMTRAFESVFRKAQDGGYQRLHQHLASGALKGLVLSYLGQRDEALPYIPPDLVRRGDVVGYPTGFSPMKHDDLERLSRRGEQLTRLLIDRYCSSL